MLTNAQALAFIHILTLFCVIDIWAGYHQKKGKLLRMILNIICAQFLGWWLA